MSLAPSDLNLKRKEKEFTLKLNPVVIKDLNFIKRLTRVKDKILDI
jgi:hypothetical protein